MTTIAALKTDAGVWIAADRAYCDGLHKRTHKGIAKLTRFSGFWVGSAGNALYNRALKDFSYDSAITCLKDAHDFAWAFTKYMDVQFQTPYSVDDPYYLLIAAPSGIYHVNGCYASEPDTAYDAIGSGAEFAKGALFAGATLEQAMHAAAKFDGGTSVEFDCFRIAQQEGE